MPYCDSAGSQLELVNDGVYCSSWGARRRGAIRIVQLRLLQASAIRCSSTLPFLTRFGGTSQAQLASCKTDSRSVMSTDRVLSFG